MVEAFSFNDDSLSVNEDTFCLSVDSFWVSVDSQSLTDEAWRAMRQVRNFIADVFWLYDEARNVSREVRKGGDVIRRFTRKVSRSDS